MKKDYLINEVLSTILSIAMIIGVMLLINKYTDLFRP